MTWTLLAPLYLLGGLAIAIPIWLHLRNRRPTEVIFFPTLRFLTSATVKSRKWREILRWIILACRILALLALAAAFARPWMHVILPPSGKLSVLILDASASMRPDSKWEKTLENAEAWLSENSRDSRTSIILMGKIPRLLTAFGDSTEKQSHALQSLKPTWEGTSPVLAVRMADQLLASQPARKKQITVISDMAANAWEKNPWDQPLSPGIQIDVRPISTDSLNACGIMVVETPRSFWKANAPISMEVTVRNFSKSQTIDRTLSLEINGREALRQTAVIAPLSDTKVHFTHTPSSLDPLQGKIALSPSDSFIADDTRYFFIPSQKPFRVGRLRTSQTSSDTFLKTAILPRQDPGENIHRWTEISTDSTVKIKDEIDFLILDQGEPLPPPLAQSIREFVQEGGSIMMFLGTRHKLLDWESKFIPITLGNIQNSGSLSGPQHFTQIQSQHPIMKPFFQPRGGDLFRVQIRSWRSFQGITGQPLASMANGDPILSLIPIEKGQVILFAFPLTREWSDWPIQATFLPLVHQILQWAEKKNPGEQQLLVGDLTSDGIPAVEPGFLLSPRTQKIEGAVNVDPEESDMSIWKNHALLERLSSPASSDIKRASLLPDEGSRDEKNFYWWLFFAMLLLSVSELLLANRTPR